MLSQPKAFPRPPARPKAVEYETQRISGTTFKGVHLRRLSPAGRPARSRRLLGRPGHLSARLLRRARPRRRVVRRTPRGIPDVRRGRPLIPRRGLRDDGPLLSPAYPLLERGCTPRIDSHTRAPDRKSVV